MPVFNRGIRQQLWRYEVNQSVTRRTKLSGQESNGEVFQELEGRMGLGVACSSIEYAEHGITGYVIGYYGEFRPLTHNGGLIPNMAER